MAQLQNMTTNDVLLMLKYVDNQIKSNSLFFLVALMFYCDGEWTDLSFLSNEC